MSMFCNGAYSAMAKLLEAIEAGAEWPEDCMHAKSVFLQKDPLRAYDPSPTDYC